jgi:hypothetical protein
MPPASMTDPLEPPAQRPAPPVPRESDPNREPVPDQPSALAPPVPNPRPMPRVPRSKNPPDLATEEKHPGSEEEQAGGPQGPWLSLNS